MYIFYWVLVLSHLYKWTGSKLLQERTQVTMVSEEISHKRLNDVTVQKIAKMHDQ